MNSFLNIDDVKQETKVTGKGDKEKSVSLYPSMYLADIYARWLIEASSSKQNKYVVCKNWDITRSKEVSDRGINDLSNDAQDWVFTMVYLTAATKDNACVKTRDDADLTLAKNYNVPAGCKLTDVICYSHRVGITQLLGELDKFCVSTECKFEVDMKRIMSPDAVDKFIKRLNHGEPNDENRLKTQAYQTSGVLTVNNFEAFFTEVEFEDGEKTFKVFETLLNDSAKYDVEFAQLLRITGKAFKGLGEIRETYKDEVLMRWLSNPVSNN